MLARSSFPRADSCARPEDAYCGLTGRTEDFNMTLDIDPYLVTVICLCLTAVSFIRFARLGGNRYDR